MTPQELTLPTGLAPSFAVDPGSLVVGWLVIVSGVDCGKFFPLTYGVISLGAGKNNTMVVSPEYEGIAEEFHCAISLTKDNRLFELRGPQSVEFPVFVNGNAISDSTILLGSETILIGNLKMVFVSFCNEKFFWPETMIPESLLPTCDPELIDTDAFGEIPIVPIPWDVEGYSEFSTGRIASKRGACCTHSLQKNWLFICSNSMMGDRNEQQDTVGYWHNAEWAFFVLADGAGGHSMGMAASQAVVRTASRYWKASVGFPSPSPRLWLEAFLKQANEKVREETYRGGRSSAIGMLLHRSGSCHMAHVGDCRAYHLREGEICFRTKDDNVAQLLVDQGLLSEIEANVHRTRHQLTQALGESICLDVGYQEFLYKRGDSFFLCTDGVWNVINDSLISTSLADVASPMYWKGPDCGTRQREYLASTVASLFHSIGYLSSGDADNASCIIVSMCPFSKEGDN